MRDYIRKMIVSNNISAGLRRLFKIERKKYDAPNDADIERSVEAIKKAYDEYEKLKDLQYEFMDNHEKLSEGVYRTTYSDGTVITVDYNKETYTVAKK